MKNACALLFATGLLVACGRTDSAKDNAQSSSAAATESTVAAAAKPKNCRSVADAGTLGKPLDYKESAKPLKFTLTLNQDTSTTETTNGCYFNNTVTILATKTSGAQRFKRTLTKDDLALFAKNDETIGRSMLQKATYKPTFNSEKYFLLTMRMLDPVSQKTADYTLIMNYYGEIVKVK